MPLPTLSNQYATVGYVSSVIPTSLIGSNNTWTGTNTFNTSLPTTTLVPTLSTQLTSKSYVDSAITTASSGILKSVAGSVIFTASVGPGGVASYAVVISPQPFSTGGIVIAGRENQNSPYIVCSFATWNSTNIAGNNFTCFINNIVISSTTLSFTIFVTNHYPTTSAVPPTVNYICMGF